MTGVVAALECVVNAATVDGACVAMSCAVDRLRNLVLARTTTRTASTDATAVTAAMDCAFKRLKALLPAQGVRQELAHGQEVCSAMVRFLSQTDGRRAARDDYFDELEANAFILKNFIASLGVALWLQKRGADRLAGRQLVIRQLLSGELQ